MTYLAYYICFLAGLALGFMLAATLHVGGLSDEGETHTSDNEGEL